MNRKEFPGFVGDVSEFIKHSKEVISKLKEDIKRCNIVLGGIAADTGRVDHLSGVQDKEIRNVENQLEYGALESFGRAQLVNDDLSIEPLKFVIRFRGGNHGDLREGEKLPSFSDGTSSAFQEVYGKALRGLMDHSFGAFYKVGIKRRPKKPFVAVSHCSTPVTPLFSNEVIRPSLSAPIRNFNGSGECINMEKFCQSNETQQDIQKKLEDLNSTNTPGIATRSFLNITTSISDHIISSLSTMATRRTTEMSPSQSSTYKKSESSCEWVCNTAEATNTREHYNGSTRGCETICSCNNTSQSGTTASQYVTTLKSTALASATETPTTTTLTTITPTRRLNNLFSILTPRLSTEQTPGTRSRITHRKYPPFLTDNSNNGSTSASTEDVSPTAESNKPDSTTEEGSDCTSPFSLVRARKVYSASNGFVVRDLYSLFATEESLLAEVNLPEETTVKEEIEMNNNSGLKLFEKTTPIVNNEGVTTESVCDDIDSTDTANYNTGHTFSSSSCSENAQTTGLKGIKNDLTTTSITLSRATSKTSERHLVKTNSPPGRESTEKHINKATSTTNAHQTFTIGTETLGKVTGNIGKENPVITENVISTFDKGKMSSEADRADTSVTRGMPSTQTKKWVFKPLPKLTPNNTSSKTTLSIPTTCPSVEAGPGGVNNTFPQLSKELVEIATLPGSRTKKKESYISRIKHGLVSGKFISKKQPSHVITAIIRKNLSSSRIQKKETKKPLEIFILDP